MNGQLSHWSQGKVVVHKGTFHSGAVKTEHSQTKTMHSQPDPTNLQSKT